MNKFHRISWLYVWWCWHRCRCCYCRLWFWFSVTMGLCHTQYGSMWNGNLLETKVFIDAIVRCRWMWKQHHKTSVEPNSRNKNRLRFYYYCHYFCLKYMMMKCLEKCKATRKLWALYPSFHRNETKDNDGRIALNTQYARTYHRSYRTLDTQRRQ